MFAPRKWYTNSRRFLKEFPARNWRRAGLDRLIKKIDKLGSIVSNPSSGRPLTVRNYETIKQVGELVQSQEKLPQTHLTVRQIAGTTDIQHSFVHCLVKHDLNLKFLKNAFWCKTFIKCLSSSVNAIFATSSIT